ncbi:MAG: transposase [Ktedonobacterales bacterium]
MPRHISLEPHLTADELEARYRRSHDLVERSHWHFLWLLAHGMTATAIASITGYSAYWIGTDLPRFPSAEHLASWAGMCPGNAESGGRRLSGRTRHGNAWLRRTLAEVANVTSRMKGTYLAAQYRRIAARRGKGRAVVAVGHSVLVAIYYMLTRREPYRELGAQYFDEHERDHVQRRLVRRLERLGYAVTLDALPATS